MSIVELSISSTYGIENDSFLWDNSDGTCVPVNQTNYNNPPTFYIKNSNIIKEIKLQIVFKESTTCANNEIFYVNSSSLSKRECNSPIIRKCKFIVSQVPEGKYVATDVNVQVV